MNIKQVIKPIVAVLIVELIGTIGVIFTFPALAGWYSTLNKPWFNPPDWAFGPAWTILYALMGIAVWLIWEKGLKNKNVRSSVVVFGGQLALNVLWPILFFGLHSPLYGLVGIIFLLIAIAFTIIKFYRVSKTASALLMPYILWVAFAALLNFYVWMLN